MLKCWKLDWWNGCSFSDWKSKKIKRIFTLFAWVVLADNAVLLTTMKSAHTFAITCWYSKTYRVSKYCGVQYTQYVSFLWMDSEDGHAKTPPHPFYRSHSKRSGLPVACSDVSHGVWSHRLFFCQHLLYLVRLYFVLISVLPCLPLRTVSRTTLFYSLLPGDYNAARTHELSRKFLFFNVYPQSDLTVSYPTVFYGSL